MAGSHYLDNTLIILLVKFNSNRDGKEKVVIPGLSDLFTKYCYGHFQKRFNSILYGCHTTGRFRKYRAANI